MATKETALDSAATELEALVKSHEPQKQEETLVEELVKSATQTDEKPKQEPVVEVTEKTPAIAEDMKKSLAENDDYQQVVDVSDAMGVMGDAMVKGFTGVEKLHRETEARIERMERNLGLMMKAQAVILKGMEERSPVRTPMTGHFGAMQKSQTVKDDGKLPFSMKQLDRAANLLIEQGKLPAGSGARKDARGPEALYKSLGREHQELFAKMIEDEQISA